MNWFCHQRSFVAVLSINCIQLFANPWTAAPQASLSLSISQSLLKPMSFNLVMTSNHLSSSIVSFSYWLQSFPVSVFFQWICFLHQVAMVLELQHLYPPLCEPMDCRMPSFSILHPSSSPETCSNSSLSRWCHPTILCSTELVLPMNLEDYSLVYFSNIFFNSQI